MIEQKYIEIFKYLLIVGIFFLALVTSWEDIRERRIRNKWLLCGIGFAGVMQILSIITLLIFIKTTPFTIGNELSLTIHYDYYGKIFLNALCAFVVAIAIWKVNVWSAGDSKLFATFAFMYPIDYYNKGYMNIFPAASLLINIFLVSFVVVILHTVVDAFILHRARTITFDFRVREYASSVGAGIKTNWAVYVVVFAMFSILLMGVSFAKETEVGKHFGILISLGIFVIAFVIMSRLTARLRELFAGNEVAKRASIAAVIVTMVLMFIIYPPAMAMMAKQVKRIIIFMFTVGVALNLISLLIDKTEIARAAAATPMQTEDAEIENVHESLATDSIREIMKDLPFAPMASLGVLLTLILKCSAIHYLFSGL